MTARPKPARRQIFVFTPQEKAAAACVVGALLLGFATKQYREAHPRKPPPLSARQQYQQQRAKKAAEAYARSARAERAAGSQRSRPSPTPDEGEEKD